MVRVTRHPDTGEILSNGQPQPKNVRPIDMLPDLDPGADQALREQHALLSSRLNKLQTAELAHEAKRQEFRGRSIDNPPTWQEREAIEKNKIANLKERQSVLAEAVELGKACQRDAKARLQKLPNVQAAEDVIAEELRGIGFTLQRDRSTGAYKFHGSQHNTAQFAILQHPDRAACVRRLNVVRSTMEAWQRLTTKATAESMTHEATVEQERQRIMQVA